MLKLVVNLRNLLKTDIKTKQNLVNIKILKMIFLKQKNIYDFYSNKNLNFLLYKLQIW